MSTRHTARSILESFYAAERIYMSAPPEERDFAGMAATLSPDVHLEQSSGLPYAGTFKGPQGFLDWAKSMANYFDVVDVQNPEIFEREGSERIISLGNLHLRVRKTGEKLHFPLCQVIKVDLEAGVITSIQPFYWDVYELNRAIGHRQ
ncbi:SnoaL-like domain-containing protein [Fusarium keratoplasticum]|nr:SnoaL-like domain-containing protein [Fusarium keratoplasticum]